MTGSQINSKWAALRLIDGDMKLLGSIKDYLSIDLSEDAKLQELLCCARTELEADGISLVDLGDRIVSVYSKLPRISAQRSFYLAIGYIMSWIVR